MFGIKNAKHAKQVANLARSDANILKQIEFDLRKHLEDEVKTGKYSLIYSATCYNPEQCRFVSESVVKSLKDEGYLVLIKCIGASFSITVDWN